MAAASSCAGSRVPTSQSDTKPVVSPTAALKRDLEGVEAHFRGLADRWARVEAELLRITCEETFLRRQQHCPLHGIFAPDHGEGRQVFMFEDPIILFLVELDCFFILGLTPCAPDFKAQTPGTPDLAARARRVPGYIG